jgi:hypothetical protein
MFNAPQGANMETAKHHPEVVSPARLAAAERKGGTLVSLASETRAAVDTAAAAFHLNRQPQTVRAWACLENGPLRPLRMHGRLMWPTAKLRELCGVAA